MTNHEEATTSGESQFQLLEHQVAGHGGVLSVGEGKMVAKPLIKREQEFYEASAQCAKFKAFIPEYYGTLQQQDGDGSSTTADSSYICLENLTDGYEKPCILDVKIGTRIHDIDATPEKVAKMLGKAQETTTGSLGVRICGMSVQGTTGQERDWFAKLTVDTIREAFAMYFSAAESMVSAEYRRFVINQFILEVEELAAVIKSVETRMYASSLLFVYDASKARYEQFVSGASCDGKSNCDGNEDDEDAEEDECRDGLLDVKAIDFAHSHWVPGQGCDEFYLFGLEKLVEILRGLLAEEPAAGGD
ncbi:hypothetical protein GGI03_001559 [Coemansia sp. RSA 2337]|nr:hypothetical protein GGI14_001652 [Coemansia sp. S680]KAJ2062633.1 hypothetical protein GGI08_002645 [Coemansia sp. S2]KAJ2467455.1 hypothetical protein GGI03_001559 [Coemansia sp. RSA 2337]